MKKILIIEDNEQFSLMLYGLLQEAGLQVYAALSGKEGLKAAQVHHPDLILLDYQLGDMTGWDVATLIGYSPATKCIPFILLSSLAGDPLLISGFKRMSNCRGAVCKSRPAHELLAAVKLALGL